MAAPTSPAPVQAPPSPDARSGRRRTLIAAVAALAVLAPLGWLWQASLLPSSYSVMDMGHRDEGRGGDTGQGSHHAGHDGPTRSVDSLVEPSTAVADVRVDLAARNESFRLGSGQAVEGYTLNGSSPGPVITAEQGQLVEVRLTNESVPDGVTLHWHGVDVPNAVDGVAGVMQDAVPVGGAHVYRFRAEQVGTFWYHAHQMSHEQVQGGLLGALVITPRGGMPDVVDALALVHVYDGVRTVNGQPGETRRPARRCACASSTPTTGRCPSG